MKRFLWIPTTLLVALGTSAALAQTLPDDIYEPNNSMEQATPWECGETTEIANIRDDNADIDYFRVEVEEDDTLLQGHLRTGFPDLVWLDGLIVILDSDGNLLNGAENWPFNDVTVSAVVDSGTYYIVVTGWPDYGLQGTVEKLFGHYELTVECEPIVTLDYSIGGGGSATNELAQRATIRFDLSGEAPDIEPYGPNSFEAFEGIEGSVSLYNNSTRQRFESTGPFDWAAGIDSGGGFVEVIAEGEFLRNGNPVYGQVYAHNFAGLDRPYFEFIDLTAGEYVYWGFGLPGRSNLSMTLTPQE